MGRNSPSKVAINRVPRHHTGLERNPQCKPFITPNTSMTEEAARDLHLKCGLVYVAEYAYMLSRAWVPHHAKIKKFAGDEITRVEDLLAVLSKLFRGD